MWDIFEHQSDLGWGIYDIEQLNYIGVVEPSKEGYLPYSFLQDARITIVLDLLESDSPAGGPYGC
jgi:hypothetical protein